MNLSEFRALIAEYALEHPERPLSDVSMVEFAEWREGKSEAPDLIIFDETHELKTSRPVEKMRDYAERHGYAAKQAAFVTRRSLDSGRLPSTYRPPMHNVRPCKPQCAECGGPLPADAIADGSRLCSPECVDDYFYPGAVE